MTTLDKPDVLAGLFAVWDEIDTLLDRPSRRAMASPVSLPGWSVHDVTAHLIGTESMLQGIATPDADIDVIDAQACSQRHRRDERAVGAQAAWRISVPDMLEKFRATTANRREALTAMADDDWNQITATPAGPDTYGRFMRVRDFDCWMHLQDIRDALDRPTADADLGGPSARLALDEMAATHGVRGRQAR